MFNINLETTKNEINAQNKEVIDRLIVSEVLLDELRECEENPYTTEGIEQLAEQIKVMGLQHPIKVLKTNEVISGHRRLKAYKLLSEEDEQYLKIPVIYIDDFETEDEKLLYLVYENASRHKTKDERNAEIKLAYDSLMNMKNNGTEEQKLRLKNANIKKLTAAEFNTSEATVHRATTENKPKVQNELSVKKTSQEKFDKVMTKAFKLIDKYGDELNLEDELFNAITDHISVHNQIELN